MGRKNSRKVIGGWVIWWSRRTPFDENKCTVYRFKKDAVEVLQEEWPTLWKENLWRIRPVTMGCELALIKA